MAAARRPPYRQAARAPREPREHAPGWLPGRSFPPRRRVTKPPARGAARQDLSEPPPAPQLTAPGSEQSATHTSVWPAPLWAAATGAARLDTAATPQAVQRRFLLLVRARSAGGTVPAPASATRKNPSTWFLPSAHWSRASRYPPVFLS